MVAQETPHPAFGPLTARPQLDPRPPPLVELAAPFAEARCRVRHRAAGDLRAVLIHDPDRMRLIRPIDAQVVAHSSPPFRPESVNGKVGLIPALRGATFS